MTHVTLVFMSNINIFHSDFFKFLPTGSLVVRYMAAWKTRGFFIYLCIVIRSTYEIKDKWFTYWKNTHKNMLKSQQISNCFKQYLYGKVVLIELFRSWSMYCIAIHGQHAKHTCKNMQKKPRQQAPNPFTIFYIM